MSDLLARPFDNVWFRAASGGTGSFVVASAMPGFDTPADAGVPDSTPLAYSAYSDDLQEYEQGFGLYATSGTVLGRGSVVRSSNSDNVVNFTAAPHVRITLLSRDLWLPGWTAWQTATESGGEVSFDCQGGRLLNWRRTAGATAEIQAPANLPDGMTAYLELDPNGQTITWAAAYRADVPDPTNKALIAIVRSGSEYIAVLSHEVAS